ncbi:MAG: GxxExxY protein [Sphingomonadaceae bacterium]
MVDVEALASIAVDCGYHLHKDVGPGLFESVYEIVLAERLTKRGLVVERQKQIAFQIDDIEFSDGFRADLLINGRLLIELKSVESLAPIHTKQVVTYLRLMNLPLGLLMNFGAAQFRDGIRRIVNAHSAPN